MFKSYIIVAAGDTLQQAINCHFPSISIYYISYIVTCATKERELFYFSISLYQNKYSFLEVI